MSELNSKDARPRLISVEMAATINLGNFENIKVAIGSDDVTRPGETWAEARDRVYDEVEESLIMKVNEAKKMVKEG